MERLGVSIFRQLSRKPYRMVYYVTDRSVAILLVADGRRDMDGLLRSRLLGD